MSENNPKTHTRRTLLEWFGTASALSLAGLSLRCESADDAVLPGGDAGGAGADDTGPAGTSAGGAPDTGAPDTGAPDTGAADTGAGPAAGIQFNPTSDASTPIVPWGENTVDPQDTQALIDTWSLTVDGLVATPTTLSFAELMGLLRQDQITDFHCVEGWSVYDVPWNGVHMSTLFDLVKPLAAATHVTFHCVQAPNDVKYDESLPLSIALEPKTLLAYGAADLALPLRHGFPLRCVIPRLLGYKGAKTIERVELTDHPVDGFWVRRGYPYDAEVPEERLREGKY